MVTEETAGVEVTTEQGSDSAEAAPEVTKEVVEGGEAESTETEKETVVPEFKPDFKLKVYDEEKELDDPFLKALIKDADSEKKVKEIAQKYLGFDTVKDRHEKVKTEYQTYKQQAEPIVNYYNHATNILQKKDYDAFFELLQIPQDDIFRYAVKKAEEQQLPPEQRQQMEYQRQIQREREMLANQNQQLQTQSLTQLQQFRNQELNWVMARPEVHGVAQAFDARNGQGAFRQLVAEKGMAHYAATGKDLSAEQATQEVLKLIGGFVTPTNLTGQPAAPMQSQGTQQSAPPPVIPNVSGKGTSPVKKKISSLADLKRVSHEVRSRQT